MEILSQPLLQMATILSLLLLFHLAFFRRFYFINPYAYFTSELASTAFPSTILLGRELRRGRLPRDPYYYQDYTGIPFLYSFYQPHMLVSMLTNMMPLNQGYILYMLGLMLHFLWASLGTYLLFTCYNSILALLSAILLPYSAYCIKQNSSIIYTLSWLPWLLLGADTRSVDLLGTAIGATLLAGYWPLGILNIGLSILWWVLH